MRPTKKGFVYQGNRNCGLDESLVPYCVLPFKPYLAAIYALINKTIGNPKGLVGFWGVRHDVSDVTSTATTFRAVYILTFSAVCTFVQNMRL